MLPEFKILAPVPLLSMTMVFRAIGMRKIHTMRVATRSTGAACPPKGAGRAAPVDLTKVAAIRARIANGFYPIDPRAIADKMIALDIVRSGRTAAR